MSVEFNAFQDALITKIYSAPSFAERRKRYKTLVPRLAPLTKQQIYKRAISLGAAKPLSKPLPWSEEELAIVERFNHQQDATISRKLAKAGFKRSVNAVHRIRHRVIGAGVRQGKVDAGIYTANQVGEIVGANASTVSRWIQKGWLKARRGQFHGSSETWEVQSKDLRTFLIHYIAYCDLGRADKFTLIDVLCPHGVKDAGREAA